MGDNFIAIAVQAFPILILWEWKGEQFVVAKTADTVGIREKKEEKSSCVKNAISSWKPVVNASSIVAIVLKTFSSQSDSPFARVPGITSLRYLLLFKLERLVELNRLM
jgi:hypothetical protein